MTHRLNLILFSTILAVIFAIPSVGFPASLEDGLANAEREYNDCFNTLPVKARWQLNSPSSRGMRKFSRRQQDDIENCLDKRRIRDDYEKMIAFSSDLKSLLIKEISEEDRAVMESEADQISSIIINKTRELAKKYGMGKSPLWHNFLIKLGSKKGGYCYHWAQEILKAFPNRPFTYFERHWGVHNQGEYTENNAIIITARGMPLSKGVVYDPWRGKGAPYWKYVTKDKQKWDELFTENDIIYGQIWLSLE